MSDVQRKPAIPAVTDEQTAGQYMDSVPISKFHRKVFWLIALGALFDAFDIYIGSSVGADLVKEHITDAGGLSYFLSAIAFGMMIGAGVAGYAGDRFGRRTLYQYNLLLFGITSLLAAVAPNYGVLIALRFAMGLGLGAEIVLGYAMFAEFIPASLRGRWIGWMAMLANGGLFVAALLSFALIPSFGWRSMFIAAGVPTLVLWWFRRSLPESPRWLITRGRTLEAAQVLQEIDQQTEGSPDTAPLPVPATAPADSGRFVDLIRGPLLSRSLVSIFLFVVINLGVYGFVSWLPTILVQQGISIFKSLGISLLISAGAIVGPVIAALIADRVSTRKAIAGLAILISAAGAFYANVHTNTAVVLAGFVFTTVLYCFVVMGQAVYIPVLFPSSLRIRGTGLASVAGRMASVLVPYIVAATLPLYGFGGVVSGIAILFVITAAVVMVWGIDVQGKSLEELGAKGVRPKV